MEASKQNRPTKELAGVNRLYDLLVSAAYQTLLPAFDCRRQLILSVSSDDHAVTIQRFMHKPLLASDCEPRDLLTVGHCKPQKPLTFGNSQLHIEKRFGEKECLMPDGHLVRLLSAVDALWKSHGDTESAIYRKLDALLSSIGRDASRFAGSSYQDLDTHIETSGVLRKNILERLPSLNEFRDGNCSIKKAAILPILGVVLGITAIGEAHSLGCIREKSKLVVRCTELYGHWKQNDPIVRCFRELAFEDSNANNDVKAVQILAEQFSNVCPASCKTRDVIRFLKPLSPTFFNNPSAALREAKIDLMDAGEEGTRILAALQKSTIRPPDFSLASIFIEESVRHPLRPDEFDRGKAARAWDAVAKVFREKVARLMSK